MFHAPAYSHNNSLKIASVLEDIGVNERMVLKRRRSMLLRETMRIIKLRSNDISSYYLGSQTEGTTTRGLYSDYDLLIYFNDVNVIQMWEEWKLGSRNFMMIQDENTTPGYCFLQELYGNQPLPVSVYEDLSDNHAIYKGDKVILKNSIFNRGMKKGMTREGAAFTASQTGYADLDQVFALPCKSFPRSVRAWLDKQAQTENISNQMKKYMKSNPCLVVQTGCKGSPYEEYEWRISTSFIERCLMFNLNITQIQCYVMMKLVLKTYLDQPKSKWLSSFMCKNIVLLCIKHISSDLWKSHNILRVFTFCLLRLKRIVLSGECPHFIIHTNNLLRRKLSSESKAWLVDRIDFVIQSHGCAFLGIKIDDFDSRLMSKFNIANETFTVVDTPEIVSMKASGGLLNSISDEISFCEKEFLVDCLSGKSDLSSILRTLTEIYSRGCKLDQAVCRLLTPPLCSTLGCIKASDDIQRGRDVYTEALNLLSAGLNSDLAFSRLKLASVLYCVGEMNTVGIILRQIEEHYHLNMVEPVCKCYNLLGRYERSQLFDEYASSHNEYAVRHITAFCVRFLPSEINCIPHELRHEMFRSTPEDMPHRGDDASWMDWAVIDSLPYLFFLQYKNYARLHRYNDQRQALTNLARSIFTEKNFGHRETALNLLGQCMEQEGRPQDALHCYTMSLRLRPMNNAAKLHICRLLSSSLRT